MNEINKDYVTDRKVSRHYFKYCKQSVKEYMKTAPADTKRFFEIMLDKCPECYTFLYALEVSIQKDN